MKISKDKAKKIVAGIAILAVIGALVIAIILDSRVIRPDASKLRSGIPGSLVNVSVDNGVLKVEPERFKVKLGDYTAYFGIDTTGDEMLEVTNEEDTIILSFIRDEKRYDILVTNRAMNRGSFTADEIMEICSDKESDKPITKTSSNENGLFISESVANIYNLGYVYVSEQVIVLNPDEADADSIWKRLDSSATAKLLRDTMLFEKKETNDIEVEINGLGNVRFGDIEEIGKVGFSYSSLYGMLNIIDCNDYSVKLFITNMNNPNLGNSPVKLIQHSKYPNVYYDCEFYRADAYGYKSFAVMTEAGMYYFKMSEHTENETKFMTDILNEIGVSKDDDKIELPFELVLNPGEFVHTDEDINNILSKRNIELDSN